MMMSMMQEIVDSLKKNECTPIVQKPFTVAFQCSKSIVLKSPSQQWSVMIPATKLNKIQKTLLNKQYAPQSIDIGEFVQKGTWGLVQSFIIPNEVKIYHNQFSLESYRHRRIQELHQELNAIQKEFSNPTISLNLFNEFKKRTKDMANEVNIISQKSLQAKHGNQPIICKSVPHVYKNIDSTRGEYPVYKIYSYCLVPKIQKQIEDVLDASLIDGRISQHDMRYINSKMTKDKSMVLHGIQLYQSNMPSPYFKFTIDNESTLLNNGFYKKIVQLERNFNITRNDPIPALTEADLIRNLI